MTARRAAAYPRVSSTGQEQDGTSLESQERAIRAYCTERGYTLDEEHVYREVHTGVELWERPKLTEMRSAARDRRIDVIVAYAVDRLARDPVHLGVILSEAEHVGVRVEFVTEPLDDTPEGQLIRFVKGYAAKVEHEKIKERTMRGRRERVLRGRLNHAPRAPYGYVWGDEKRGTLREDPHTAPVVRRIIRDIALGGSARSVCAALMAEGIPSPGGSPVWYASTIGRLLDNPSYVGRPRANRFRQEKTANGKRRSVKTAVETQIALPDGTVPAIVDHAVWEAARLAHARHRTGGGGARRDHSFLVRGFATCGACGSTMHAVHRASGRERWEYRCRAWTDQRVSCSERTTITRDLLDQIVWDAVTELLLDERTIRRQIAALRTGVNPADANLAAIEQPLAAARKRLETLMRRFAMVDDDVLAQSLLADITQWKARVDALSAEHALMLAERDAWARDRDESASLLVWVEELRDRVAELTGPQRTLALRALRADVRVFRPHHEARVRMAFHLEGRVIDVLFPATVVERSRGRSLHDSSLTVIIVWPRAA